MRSEYNLVEGEKWMALRGRLVVENTRDPLPVDQSGGQRGLVYDPAAGGVDDDGARLERANSLTPRIGRPTFGTFVETRSVQASPSASVSTGGIGPSGQPCSTRKGSKSSGFHPDRHSGQMPSV
jgi:hypothetical protein